MIGIGRSLILESTYFVLINIWKWSVYQLPLITLPYQHRQRVLYLAGKLYRIICNNLTTAWHCHAHRIFLFKFVCITYLKRTIIFSNDWAERHGIILLFLHITARRAFVIVRLRLYCYWIRWYSRQIFKYPQNSSVWNPLILLMLIYYLYSEYKEHYTFMFELR